MNRYSRAGFTLLETAIVLLVIGLLSAGVLIGRDLVVAANVRMAIKQHETYVTAVRAFQDKYHCLPGDCANASDYWTEASSAICYGTWWGNGDPVFPNVCNGNGNTRIEWGYPTAAAGEVHGFWEQLALSGILQGSFTGVRARVTPGDGTLDGWPFTVKGGVNAPANPIADNACWSVLSTANDPDDNPRSDTFYPESIENIFTLGSSLNLPTGNLDYCYNPSFTANAAWNIDTKVDDGKPGTGKVNGWLGGSGRTPDCLILNTGDPVNEPDKPEYNVTKEGYVCSLIFRDGI